MNKNETLCICLPTCEPDTLRKYWLSSVHHLSSAKEYITIAINFQKPYTDNDINDIVNYLENLGFNVKWSFNTYVIPAKGYIPFNKIRYDAAKLVPNAKYYALTDDDFKYCG